MHMKNIKMKKWKNVIIKSKNILKAQSFLVQIELENMHSKNLYKKT